MPNHEADPSDKTEVRAAVEVEIVTCAPETQLHAADPVMLADKQPNPPELTELHAAITAKNLKQVKEILRRGVDVNALHSNYDLGFPITHALGVGDTRIIRALLEAGADPNRADYLSDFIEENNLPVAKLLVAHGADLNGLRTWEVNEEFETNLIRATRLGRTEFVKLLLAAGADPNLHDANDESALFVARMAKNRRLVKLLESHVSEAERAWVEERFSVAYAARIKLDGEIRAAIHAGQVDRVVELFKSTGRPLDTPLDPTFLYPLEEAFSAYFRARGKSEYCPPMGFRNWKEFQNYPVHSDPAVQKLVEMIKSLIDLGAPVEKGVYFPPLCVVSGMWDPNVNILHEMLKKCSDVDVRSTMDGETPLMSAAVCHQVEMTRILLAHGADPNARNNHGESVLQRVRDRKIYEGPNPCVPLLLDAGAKE